VNDRPVRRLVVRLLPAFVVRFQRGVRARLRRHFDSRRLRREARAARSIRLIVGNGGLAAAPGWIPTDIEYLNLLRPDDWARYFAPASVAAILAEHVWEHLTPADGLTAAQVCHRYLQPGGYLRVAVPDGFHPDPAYIESVKIGGTGAGADDHKVLYTHETLSRLLIEAGFAIELLEYFDRDGVFHATDWNPADGMVHRSRRFDERNRDGQLHYTSLLLDARKKAGA